MRPSLSVVHVVPSLRRNEAPADSSPPKPGAVDQAWHEPLEADGDFDQLAAELTATRSIIDELTSVLPIAQLAGQPPRWANK